MWLAQTRALTNQEQDLTLTMCGVYYHLYSNITDTKIKKYLRIVSGKGRQSLHSHVM